MIYFGVTVHIASKQTFQMSETECEMRQMPEQMCRSHENCMVDDINEIPLQIAIQ